MPRLAQSFTANVLELRRGPPKTTKLPQSIQSPEGVDLIPSRDGRIDLRLPSAILGRLAENIRIFKDSVTLGSNRRPPEPHSAARSAESRQGIV